MISEPFAAGDSFAHRLDPRLKIVLATAYSFVVALLNQFPSLIAALVFSLVMVGLSRLNVREVAWRMVLVNGMIFFFWLVLPLTTPGEALFHLGPLAVTRPGVLLSACITLKSNAILLAFMALVSTSSLATLGHAMNRLSIPDKMVHLLLLTYRYLFVIEQEYERLVRAAKVRGFRARTDIHTYRTYAYLIGMLFVRSSERAERVHQAMVCRGFKGRFYCLREFSTSWRDWVVSAFITATIMGLEILEWLSMR